MFTDYLKNMKTPESFIPTGLTKKYYMDIIEICFDAYPTSEIKKMEATDDIQTYSRLVNCLAGLISSGKKQECSGFFLEIMTNACNALELVKGTMMVDFSVKELLSAYIFIHKCEFVTEEYKKLWAEKFKLINPDTYYRFKTGDDHNINIYNLSGEWLRKKLGFSDDDDSYFNNCFEKQLLKFDKNGMYMDDFKSNPHRNSMLYDLSTRVQMQLILGMGYNGIYKEKFDEVMQKGGMMSLFMQSTAFLLPYGGRSNQYLFNEGLLASNFEFEAARHKRLGNFELSGAYKRAAHKAVLTIDRWLSAKKHIKNFYGDSDVGTEGYGYFNKYMITLGSFLLNGYMFSDDTIEEKICPAECSFGNIFETTNNFSKIFASAGGYSIEIDVNANFNYDSTGLGRIHKAGMPTESGLSMPFTADAKYAVLEDAKKENLSIEAGWKTTTGEIQYLSYFIDLEYILNISEQSKENVKFSVTYKSPEFSGIEGLIETYIISKNGIEISAELINPVHNEIYFRVPLLYRNGDNEYSSKTEITWTENEASVKMKDNLYVVKTDGKIKVGNEIYSNRNGEYKASLLEKQGTNINIKLTLELYKS